MLGIIGAMTVEIEGLKKIMTEKTEKSVAGIVFTKGLLCGKEAVVAVCGEGKVNAAMCAQVMIMKYSPDMIINTGVGGGLVKNLKIADVVAAKSVVQHDMDMSPLGYKAGYICGIDAVNIPCDEKVTDLLVSCIKACGIACHTGVIASGDQFISSNDKKKWLVDTFDAVVCEMEGGAVGHVCAKNGVPFGVLRAISDGGDDEANVSFPEFAAIAAENSIKVMKTFAEKMQ